MPYFIPFFILLLLANPANAQESTTSGQSTSLISSIIDSFSISPSVSFPSFPDGSSQSALKPGDLFSIRVSTADILVSDLAADLSSLGLPATVPLTGSLGSFSSGPLSLPPGVPDGTASFTITGHTIVGGEVHGQGSVTIDSAAPLGTVEASFSEPSAGSDSWEAYVVGSYQGTGSEAIITSAFVRGYDESGSILGTELVNASAINTLPSPFSASIHIPAPEASWRTLSLGLTLTDEAGNTANITSSPFPRTEQNPVLINHTQGGAVVAASNYVPDGIPEGVGIPYSLISSLPGGNYFAVEFFVGMDGCPSDNYAINAFVPGSTWGNDVVGPSMLYSKAYRSLAGGCMQEFHINPLHGSNWMWGALSNTGTSSVIADASGVPAFAICATKEACDPIAPIGNITATSESSTTQSRGISNVLFLPGIKGSRLYNSVCGLSACEETLWPPVANVLAPNLYMDGNGKSLKEVYTKEHDIVSHAYGYSFYDVFVNQMNSIGSTHGDWRWEAASYDWRMSLSDLARNGRKDGERIYFEDATSTSYLLQELRALASTSPTGKVTIVAHSNGGLVAKELMQDLGPAATASLIDSVILVGVPQSGAPRAIGALLFGDGESLPGSGVLPEFLLSAANARVFGLSSPMAYHLLPSLLYMADVYDPLHPLLSFGEGALLSRARNIYGSAIHSYDNLLSYLLGDDGRIVPRDEDVRDPAVANSSLLQYAKDEHAKIDSWVPPEGVSVYQIAGWGDDTISGIKLYEEPVMTLHGSSTRVAYQPQFVEDGDGTVPTPSALMMGEASNVHSYWVNLPKVSEAKSYDHSTLFEVPDVENLIASIIQGVPHLSANTSTQQPQTLHPGKKLLFVLHDPAQLTISSGGKSLSISSAKETGSLEAVQAGVLGEDTYVLASPNRNYLVRVDHPETESVTLDVEELVDGVVTASSTLASAAEPNTALSFDITSGLSDMSPIYVDFDGDGKSDSYLVLSPGEIVLASAPKQEPNVQPVVQIKPKLKEAGSVPDEVQLATSTSTDIPVPVPSSTKKPAETRVKTVRGIAQPLAPERAHTALVIKNAPSRSWIKTYFESILSWLARMWRSIF